MTPDAESATFGGMLSGTQIKAVNALLVERSTNAAAVVAGVSTRTIQLWLQNEEFCTALANARNQVMTGVISQLVGASAVATRRLHEILDNPHTDLDTLLEAIKLTLSLSITENEKQQLLRRLDALEKMQLNALQPWEPTVIEGESKSQKLMT